MTANRSPKPSTYSPTGGRRSLVDAFHKLPNWLNKMEDEHIVSVANARRRSSAPLQQRELVQLILQDKVQWEKLHLAMKQQKNCTSMGLTQNLRFLIQDRINDMEGQLNTGTSSTGSGSSSSMDGSSSSRSRSFTD